MGGTVERTLEVSPTAPADARQMARDVAQHDDARATLQLILSELVSNSVVHVGDVGKEAGLRVRLRRESDRIHGEVCGPGPEFEWVPHAPELDEPGGLGLMIVDHLSDRWGISHNSHVCVWFECIDCGPDGDS
jgi:anti-sigma regulatory factor (Ser/Thr protein kinase)